MTSSSVITLQNHPGSVITVHSYKGGTGKTFVSANLAAILAMQGKNVCLIDLDLRAPSLDATFAAGKYWINDFLNGSCEPIDIIKDFSEEKNTSGKLFVALANPSMEAIRDIVTKEKRWEMGALRRLLSLKDFLLNNMSIDYMILDSSPGISYGSINAVAAADLVLVISTWDASDITGTQGIITELYELLERRSVVIVNKIPEQLIMNEELKKRLIYQFKKAFKLPVMDLLPCYCDVLRQERATIMALDNPHHPLSMALAEEAKQLEKMLGKYVSDSKKHVDINRTMETSSRLLDYEAEIYRKPEKFIINRQLQTHINNLRAIKSIQQIAEDLYQSISTYYSNEVLELSTRFIEPSQPRSRELIEKLSECSPGRENWRKFEVVCKEILTFLFVPTLLEPLEQLETESGLQVRDLILHIPCDVSGFWNLIQSKYDALAIIVECKNYSNPIEGNNVVISSKYLGERRLGRFGIVISRFPPAESAIKERKRLWLEEGKLILFLEDEDIKTMIKLKDEGNDPEIILDKKQRDFRQSLE